MQTKWLMAFFLTSTCHQNDPRLNPSILFTAAAHSAGGGSIELDITALSPLLLIRKAYHEGLVQDVCNNGFIHSVSSLQHAFGQIRHRASVAELRQKNPQRKENDERKLDMSQHL